MQDQSILHFWFTELSPKHHFAKDAALDETIRTRFGATLEATVRCGWFLPMAQWFSCPQAFSSRLMLTG